MKYFILLFTTLFVFSCGKGKVVLLPEISHSDIAEINDVSAAYIFYDETKPDSTELNRKNLISTTNWLVNVDKRLTLKQVIPHIKFLQEKKANSSHKNPNAKNYFTCNDTSKQNLGFVEFTDVTYLEQESIDYLKKISEITSNKNLLLHLKSLKEINLTFLSTKLETKTSSISTLVDDITDILKNKYGEIEIVLLLGKNISFQNYISLKSLIFEMDLKNVSIMDKEFIFN